MFDKICSFCGETYVGWQGHNYDTCVSRCYDQLEKAKTAAYKAIDHLNDAHDNFQQAMKVQKQDWWRKEKQ